MKIALNGDNAGTELNELPLNGVGTEWRWHPMKLKPALDGDDAGVEWLAFNEAEANTE